MTGPDLVVIDTNILAFLLIEGERTGDARALFERDARWKSEAIMLYEFSSILATYERQGSLSRTQGERLLGDAQSLMHGLVELPHLAALRMARRFAVSIGDARLLAAAENLGSRLSDRGHATARRRARTHPISRRGGGIGLRVRPVTSAGGWGCAVAARCAPV